MKYLKIPIVEVNDGITDEMMIDSAAIAHRHESLHMLMDQYNFKINNLNNSNDLELNILMDSSVTIKDEQIVETTAMYSDSLIFAQIGYAVDVTNGQPVPIYHTISRIMDNKNKVVITLKGSKEKTILCNIVLYELKRKDED